MILKVKNDKDSWSYFECEVVHVSYLTLERTADIGDCVVLIENKDSKMDTVIKRLNLEMLESHLRTILTDRVCYLSNNQGKTIDKI